MESELLALEELLGLRIIRNLWDIIKILEMSMIEEKAKREGRGSKTEILLQLKLILTVGLSLGGLRELKKFNYQLIAI